MISKWFCPTLLLILLSSVDVYSQSRQGTIVFSDFSKNKKCPLSRPDSISMARSIDGCIQKLNGSGYIAARADSVWQIPSGTTIFVTRGPQYIWAIDETDKMPQKGSNPFYKLNGRPVLPGQLESVSRAMVHRFENRGYPFAKVSIQQVEIDSARVQIAPEIDQGPLILWDSIYIKGNARVKERFVKQYLGFSEESLFSYSYYESLQARLSNLPFIASIRSPELEFVPLRANIYVYLTNAKASQFSGMIGMDSKGESWTDVQLTGDVNLLLRSAFGNGEEFLLRWHAPGEGSQQLRTSVAWPYVAGSNYAVEGELNLHKQDTSFVNTAPRIAVRFHTGRWQLGVGVEGKISNPMGKQSAAPNRIKGFSQILYQLSVRNYLHSGVLFPQPGVWADATVGIGSQNMKDSEAANKGTVFHYQAKLVYVQSLLPHLLLLRISSITNGTEKWGGEGQFQNLMINEMARIGGSEILRGFNQESILARSFSVGSIETHFLLQRVASIYSFVDSGWVLAYSAEDLQQSVPLGLGVGVLLSLGEGVVNLSYALGKGFGENFGFNNAKIHIGYAITF